MCFSEHFATCTCTGSEGGCFALVLPSCLLCPSCCESRPIVEEMTCRVADRLPVALRGVGEAVRLDSETHMTVRIVSE